MSQQDAWFGQLMPIALLTALLSILTAPPTAAAEPDCTLKRFASLELTETPDGSLLVPVQIKGRAAYMALNTVAALSGFTDEAVKLLDLRTEPVPPRVEVNFGRNAIQRMAIAKEFSLGSAQFRVVTFLVFPASMIGHPTGETPLVGALGMDVFAKMDVELDVSHRKMNLFSQDHCPGHAVYWSRKFDSVPITIGELGEIYFPMELDGKKLETTIATGSPLTSLTTDVTRKIYHFDKDSPDIDKETDADGKTTAHYRAMQLTGEGIQIINAHIQLVDPSNTSCRLGKRAGAAAYDECYGTHPLQLGRSVLTKLRIYIATKEKVLYFTAADAQD